MGPHWYFWPFWDLFLEILCSLDFFGHILVEYSLRFSSSASSVQKCLIIVACYSSLPMPSLSVKTLLMDLSSSPEPSELPLRWLLITTSERTGSECLSFEFPIKTITIFFVTIIPLQVLIVFHLLALMEEMTLDLFISSFQLSTAVPFIEGELLLA